MTSLPALPETTPDLADLSAYPEVTQHITADVLAGTLSKQTRTIYRREARRFLTWLAEHWACAPEQVSISRMTRADLLGYRNMLAGQIQQHECEPASAKLALTVVRLLVREAYAQELLDRDLTIHLPGFKSRHQSPYVALDAYWARRLYEAVPRDGSLLHLRDRAIMALLLGFGLRAAEVGGVTWGDFGESSGYHVLTVRGKGDKRATNKLRGDVYAAVETYARAVQLAVAPQSPLFTPLQRTRAQSPTASVPRYRVVHDRHGELKGVTRKSVWEMVKHYAVPAGVPHAEDLSPHCLRATFATLLLEGGATVDQVRIAMRHEDTKTTLFYIKRLETLANAAVDYLPKEMDFNA